MAQIQFVKLALLHDYKAKKKTTSENTKGKKYVGISW